MGDYKDVQRVAEVSTEEVSTEDDVVQVDMCDNYSWHGKSVCAEGHKADLRCHSVRLDCTDYTPPKHYPHSHPQEVGENGRH